MTPTRAPFWGLLASTLGVIGVHGTELPRLGWHWEPIEPTTTRARLAEELAIGVPAAVRSGPYRRMHDLPADVVWWPAARAFRSEDSPEQTQWRLNPDLWATFRTARSNAPAGPGEVRAIEVGNEPDLHFTPDLPHRMAATLKAAWWGLHGVRPELTILMPSAASTPGPYFEQLVANGLGGFTAGWNFHFYGWPQDFGAAIAAHRAFLRRHRLEHLPLWLTEFGFSGLPTGPLAAEPMRLGQQRAFFEQTLLEGASLGVGHQFGFCLHPSEEAGIDFGVRASDGTPRPALAAWKAMSKRLQTAQLRFRIEHRDLGSTVGWVFSLPGAEGVAERWWTVLFSPHRHNEGELPERADAPSAPGVNPVSFFEFQLAFPPTGGSVHVGLEGEHGEWNEPRLHFNASAATNLHLLSGPAPFLIRDCRWIAATAPAIPRPARPDPSPVVITLEPVGPGWEPDATRLAYRHANALPLALELRLHNFSDRFAAGRWTLALPAGWRLLAGERNERLGVATGATQARRLVVQAPPGTLARHEELKATWQGHDGRRDLASLTVRPAGAAVGFRRALPSWVAEDLWTASRTNGGEQLFQNLDRISVSRTQMVVPLPGDLHLQPDTVLRFRVAVTAGSARLRTSLITPAREVFRHGDDPLIRAEGGTMEVRVGDFTPAFWNRIGPGDPTRAGYLTVDLYGLDPATAIKLGPATAMEQK